MGETTIRLRPLDGQWEEVGERRYPGAVPESVQVRSDPAGFATCGFQLWRPSPDVWIPSPELFAYTRCEIEEGGRTIFEGRIHETPITGDDNVIAVAGRGTQYALDRDPLEQLWTHSNLADWKDSRTFPDVDYPSSLLDNGMAANLAVNAGAGAIFIGATSGTTWTQSHAVGVTFDAGPDPACWAERIAIQFRRGSGSPPVGTELWCRNFSAGGPHPGNGIGEITSFTQADITSSYSTSSQTIADSFTTPARYLSIFILRNNPSYAVTADDGIWIERIWLLNDPDSAAATSSQLKASTVIKDALDHAAATSGGDISSDRSRISTTGLVLPHFSTTEPKTPRELVEAIQAFHRYRFKIGREGVPIFEPYPTAPKWALTPDAARRFADAAANSGEELYNKVIVTGPGPGGNTTRVDRYAAGLPENEQQVALGTTPAFPNGTFDVDAANWTATSSAITRTTTAGLVRSGAGAGSWDSSSAINPLDALETTLTGTFEAGRVYVVRFWAKPASGLLVGRINAYFGVVATLDRVATPLKTTGTTYTLFTLVWVPKATYTSGVKLRLSNDYWNSETGPVLLDDFSIGVSKPTLLDQGGLLNTYRLNVGFEITEEIGAAMGDAFLRLHMRPPLRGNVDLGAGDLVQWPTERPAHPRDLVLEEGELLHLPGIPNPDTGGNGRDGVIVSVDYNPEDERAAVALDNQRDNFDVLLQRYAAVTGQA